ncbi:MAG: hypothetical protein WA006_03305 [Rhodoglobus sp.]
MGLFGNIPGAGVAPRPRGRFLAGGILFAVLALLLFLIAGVIALVGVAAQAVLQSPEGEVGHALEFDIVAGTYSIFLTDEVGEGAPEVNRAQALACTIHNAATTIEVDGGGQLISEESTVGEHVADFTAVAGPTSVTCGWPGAPDATGYTFVVAPATSVPVPTVVLLVLGGLALVGSGLNWLLWALRRPGRV